MDTEENKILNLQSTTFDKLEDLKATYSSDNSKTDESTQMRTIHLGDILTDYKGQKLTTVMEVVIVITKVCSLVIKEQTIDEKVLHEIAPVIINELIKMECLSQETGDKVKEMFFSSVDKIIIASEELTGKDINGDGVVGVGVRQSLLCCLR